jgi:hypothetical protein
MVGRPVLHDDVDCEAVERGVGRAAVQSREE